MNNTYNPFSITVRATVGKNVSEKYAKCAFDGNDSEHKAIVGMLMMAAIGELKMNLNQRIGFLNSYSVSINKGRDYTYEFNY